MGSIRRCVSPRRFMHEVSSLPRASTSEEKSAGSQYAALRTARDNHRYVGIRAERQKKKDEEEAAKYVSSYSSG